MAYPDSPPRQKVFCLGLLSLCQRFPPPWTFEELDACFVVLTTTDKSSPMCISTTSRGEGRGGQFTMRRGPRCAVSVDLRATMMRVVKSTGLPRAPETPRAATEVPCIPLNWRPREILDRL